jgi:methionyl-tRNA formyltransferase
VAVRVGFAGTNWWAAQALERLASAPGIEVAVVLCQPDRPTGRGRKPAPPPVAVTAGALGIELVQPERAADALPQLRGHGVEAVALVAYGLLVPRVMLDALPFVNLHPSALPRWRGAAPVERSLMAGESTSAVAPDEDAGAVYERALSLGLPPLAAALADAGAGRLATVPQVGEATYAEKLTAADRVLDPARPARELHDRARALSPHIGARLSLEDAAYTVWRTSVRSEGPAPGVLALDAGALLLGCGSGALELRDVQPPGGRRMPAADWLRGRRGELPAVTSA